MPPSIDRNQLADETQLGRLLSGLEADPLAAREVLAALPPPPPPAGKLGLQRVGITGAPGVGKSTLARQLIATYRAAGHRVGVVAVDPTSPLSGGAILGDRLRMAPEVPDSGLFIRSLGSRGSLGGVTPGASAVASVLEAAGYDRILIETVGVGQTGYDVICLADSVVALFSPEGGDGLQMLKAGMLEVGDIFAVNKSDRAEADAMLKEIRLSLELALPSLADIAHHGPAASTSATITGAHPQHEPAAGAAWQPPVIRLAAKTGAGIAEVHRALESHRGWLAGLPELHPRRRQRAARELAFIMRSRVSQLTELSLAGRIDALAAQVHAGQLALWDAAELLRQELRRQL